MAPPAGDWPGRCAPPCPGWSSWSPASSPIQSRACREVLATGCGRSRPAEVESHLRGHQALDDGVVHLGGDPLPLGLRHGGGQLVARRSFCMVRSVRTRQRTSDAVEVDGGGRDQERDVAAVGAASSQLAARGLGGAGLEQGRQGLLLALADVVDQVASDHAVALDVEEVGKLGVGEQDDATLGDGGGAFAHALDDHPVRPVGAGERVDLLALGRAEDDGVDTAAADGGQGLLEVGDLPAQLVEVRPTSRRVLPDVVMWMSPSWQRRRSVGGVRGRGRVRRGRGRVGEVADQVPESARGCASQRRQGEDVVAHHHGRDGRPR